MTKKSMSAVDLGEFTALKAIRLQIQECIAEGKLKNNILTDSTFNKVVDDVNTYNKYHADVARDKVIYPQPVTTQQLIDSQKERAQLTICVNNFYGDQVKRQLGCSLTTQYDYPYKEIVPSDAMPPEIRKKVNEYLSDGGRAQANEILKDNIQKSIDNRKATLDRMK